MFFLFEIAQRKIGMTVMESIDVQRDRDSLMETRSMYVNDQLFFVEISGKVTSQRQTTRMAY